MTNPCGFCNFSLKRTTRNLAIFEMVSPIIIPIMVPLFGNVLPVQNVFCTAINLNATKYFSQRMQSNSGFDMRKFCI